MSFTLNHLKAAQDALVRDDKLTAMKELGILIEKWERLHHEQKNSINHFNQKRIFQEIENDNNSDTVSQPQESLGQ